MTARKALSFIKKEVVLLISLLLAVISAFFNPPSGRYLSYIDFRVLALLFCLMTVVAGWQKTGLFYRLGFALSRRTKSIRGLTFILSALCFFTSMLITNDVALITFIPFTVSIFTLAKIGDKLINVIVIETVSANLGSMLTPVGNPQNLYLFAKSGMSMGEFMMFMLPVWGVSALAVCVLILIQRNNTFEMKILNESNKSIFKDRRLWLYTALFLVCIANVLHLIPYPAVLIIVAAAALISDRDLFRHVDWSLLLTFLFLFIFIGNISEIDTVKQWLKFVISGRELTVSALTSQVISNVPAAMLLSGFTADYKSLLWGTNIGGLGTVIASMASLISYRCYVSSANAQKGRYIKTFTVYNVALLAILLLAAFVIRCIIAY